MSQRMGGFAQRLAILVAGEDRGQVEPEPIYVHHLHPVSQAVHDQAADDGVIGIQRTLLLDSRVVEFEDGVY